MPIITVKMAKGRSAETKWVLAAELTRVAVDKPGSRPGWVSVLIEEYGRDNLATAGELRSDKKGG